MRLVVDDDDVLLGGQIAADAPHDLIGRLEKRARLALRQDRLRQARRVSALVSEKGVIVRDHDLRAREPLQQVARQDVALAIVVIRIGRQEHPQTVADGDARRHDQKRVRETGILSIVELVERLPRDEHRHHNRLARAGRHLHRHARKAGVRGVVGGAQIVVDPHISVLVRNLGDVNGGLDGFELTEKKRLLAALMRPVRKEP